MGKKGENENDKIQEELVRKGLVRPMAITIKAVVISKRTGKVLLLKRSKDELTNKNKWDLPGGHIEKGQTVEEALKREVREETGLSIEQGPLLNVAEFEKDHKCFKQEKRGLRYIAFADGEEVSLSNEHSEFQWLDMDDAIDKFSDKDSFEQEKKNVLLEAKKRIEMEKALENWKRVLADFDNYKKRTQKENSEFKKYCIQDMAHDLLPVLDNFEMAIQHVPEKERESSWTVGIMHIKKQLENVLASRGIVEIETKKGDKLDESIHEVLRGKAKGSGKILRVLKRGFKMEDKVIRPVGVEVE